MGYESVQGSQQIKVKDLWGGWFPGKNHNYIPGELGQAGPVGMTDCSNVVWFEGGLKKIFGYNNVNSTTLNSGASINSLYYSEVLDDLIGNAGSKLYVGMDGATPTDITGAIVIDSTALIDWADFQYQSTKIAIGVDGTNAPWKTDGTTAVALGGSPPLGGTCITTWQNSVWIAKGEILYFSNETDAESWDTNLVTGDNYAFDEDIVGLAKYGRQLVVFFKDHIGVLSGPGNRLLIQQNRFIDGVGTMSHNSIKSGKYNNQDVLFFHANDGIYAFNGSQNLIKVSQPIQQKYTDSTTINKWNENRFNKVAGAYWPSYSWYMLGLSDGSSTENDTGLIVDTKRPYNTEEGEVAPHWRLDVLEQMVVMEFSRSLDNNGDMFIGSDDGFVYKMDAALFNRKGVKYDAYAKTKVFDVVNNQIVTELNVLSPESGSSELSVYINASLQEGDGNLGQAEFTEDADVFDTTFIMDTSVFGGQDFLLKNVEVSNYGRFLQFKMENNLLDQTMEVIHLDLILQDTGLDPNVGN